MRIKDWKDPKFRLLNYDNCLANLPNSVLKYFDVEPVGKTLPLADELLKKEYQNIVLLLLDGLGTVILERHLSPEGSLRKHLTDSIPTVYPPTTVAATTSAISGKEPIEHGWFGWDCYYPEVDKNVTVFLNLEQGTDRPVSEESVAWKYCPYESVVSRLRRHGRQAYEVTPFVEPYPKTFEGICERIAELCAQDGRKYIYSYWNEPDHTMHAFGCRSIEAREVCRQLEEAVSRLAEDLEDTLLIVTADHGHLDGRNVALEDYPQIRDCLLRAPSIEPRTLNLFVKEGREAEFVSEFEKAFGEDFLLLTKKEALEAGLFGKGVAHPQAVGMLGDFLAIATTDLTIVSTREDAAFFRGMHAGYSEEEMMIPIIAYEL